MLNLKMAEIYGYLHTDLAFQHQPKNLLRMRYDSTTVGELHHDFLSRVCAFQLIPCDEAVGTAGLEQGVLILIDYDGSIVSVDLKKKYDVEYSHALTYLDGMLDGELQKAFDSTGDWDSGKLVTSSGVPFYIGFRSDFAYFQENSSTPMPNTDVRFMHFPSLVRWYLGFEDYQDGYTTDIYGVRDAIGG